MTKILKIKISNQMKGIQTLTITSNWETAGISNFSNKVVRTEEEPDSHIIHKCCSSP